MIPKELDFLNNRGYDWFINNSKLLTIEDFQKANFLQPSDIIFELHTEGAIKVQKERGHPLYLWIMTNFEPLNKTKYSCDVYQVILTDKKPISEMRKGRRGREVEWNRSSFTTIWIENESSWQYRIFAPFNLNFLNWPNRNPMEVKE